MKYINTYSKYLILFIIILAICYYLYINTYKNQIKKCLYFLQSNNMIKEYNKYNINYKYTYNDFEISKNNKSYKLCEINSKDAILLSSNKHKSNLLLNKNNINVCNFYIWNNNENNDNNLKNINNKLNFPIVIKYIYGQRGEDVFPNIYNNKETVNKIEYLKRKNKNYIIIEEQEFGDKYRIFVSFNKVIYIQKHNIPKITGDGKTSIHDLIKEYPNKSLQNKYNVTIKPIQYVDSNLINQQGYKLHDILEENKQIKVASVISGLNGSVIEDININNVHKSNIIMFKNINNILGLNISGIDFITNDISIPNNGKIIEVNSSPSYNVIKNKDLVNKRLVDSLFNN